MPYTDADLIIMIAALFAEAVDLWSASGEYDESQRDAYEEHVHDRIAIAVDESYRTTGELVESIVRASLQRGGYLATT